MDERTLKATLISEKNDSVSGGIYQKLQIDFAYNSNHIQSSKLTYEQTRYIYETKTVGIEPARVNDVIETVNHFRCFDRIIETAEQPLTEEYIKSLHFRLKMGCLDSDESMLGVYKIYPNIVGDAETTAPEDVAFDMKKLIKSYERRHKHSLYDIIDFHVCFERIHPFYDGNGRIGRLIMFKECLRSGIVPFVIEDMEKMYYYRGLREWENGEKGYLADTCLTMQDYMKKTLDYFKIEYDKTEYTSKDILKGN
ncbi:MAG: Fic family protein [Firmicutes bacterium]|nr:Fic family protein [Bacillota bacterium]